MKEEIKRRMRNRRLRLSRFWQNFRCEPKVIQLMNKLANISTRLLS